MSTSDADAGQEECRRRSCSNPSRDPSEAQDRYAANFCSSRCEARHDHIRADAREARVAAAEEAGRR